MSGIEMVVDGGDVVDGPCLAAAETLDAGRFAVVVGIAEEDQVAHGFHTSTCGLVSNRTCGMKCQSEIVRVSVCGSEP